MAPSMHRTLPPQDSKALRLLRWPLIVGVVFIHANNERVGLPAPEGGPALWVYWLRKGLSEGLAATAVPLFFLISGYLFFFGAPLDPKRYFEKLRKRVRTLLIPFLFWNLALALALMIALRVPAVSQFVSGQQGAFLERGPRAWIDGVFGFTQAPVNYQFWFLRDLMLAVLLAPLGALCFRAGGLASALWLAGLGGPWFLHVWPLTIPSAAALFFFFLGGFLATRGVSLFAGQTLAPVLCGGYFALLVVETVGWSGAAFAYFHQAGILVGVLTVLSLAARVATRRAWADPLQALSTSAFFLFAVHEPLLTLVRRVAEKVWPARGPWTDLAHYFATAIFVIVVATCVHRLLARVAPKPLAWVTGGR